MWNLIIFYILLKWNDPEIQMLIEERKLGNEQYHQLGRTKIHFWEEVVVRINQQFRLHYSALQCRKKFEDIVQDYKVNTLDYIAILVLLSLSINFEINFFFHQLMDKYIKFKPGGKRSRIGELYYEVLKDEFWKKPGKYCLLSLSI